MIQAYQRALIVGAGDGLSASLVWRFAANGLRVGLAARNIDKLLGLAQDGTRGMSTRTVLLMSRHQNHPK